MSETNVTRRVSAPPSVVITGGSDANLSTAFAIFEDIRRLPNSRPHQDYAYERALIVEALGVVAECIRSGEYDPLDLDTCAHYVKGCWLLPALMGQHLASRIALLGQHPHTVGPALVALAAAARVLSAGGNA